jgi:hypothetical protein
MLNIAVRPVVKKSHPAITLSTVLGILTGKAAYLAQELFII